MGRPRNSHELSANIDTLFALGFAAAAVLWANEPHMPSGGLAEFFSLRISLMNALFSVGFAIVWKQCFTVLGLYRRDMAGLYRLVLRAAGGSVIMTTLLSLYLDSGHSQRPVGKLLVHFLIVAFGYQVCRLLISSRQWSQYVTEPERVVILGSGPRASKAWRELRTQHRQSKNLLGFVDDRDPYVMPPDIASRFLGNVNSLGDYLLRNAVDELIVATPMRSCYEMTQRAVSIAENAGVRLVFLNDVYTLMHERKLRQRATMFLEFVPKDRRRQKAELAKRILDVLGAATGLVVLSPLFLMLGIAIKLTSPGPMFFVQERYGYRRRQFSMYKLRSMVRNAPDLMAGLESRNEACGPIFKIKEDPRVTRLGRFLRRTSLDELPQLWNVLLGDMSLVGPRPMSVRDVSLFSEAQLMRRFSVRPGMTGIWQVSGRSSFSFDHWVTLDFSYIDEWSFVLDLKILARTIPAVLKRSGAV
jgi:exopolysaccharide biosynthesis polyprenyl glycosylphosphotransferase